MASVLHDDMTGPARPPLFRTDHPPAPAAGSSATGGRIRRVLRFCSCRAEVQCELCPYYRLGLRGQCLPVREGGNRPRLVEDDHDPSCNRTGKHVGKARHERSITPPTMKTPRQMRRGTMDDRHRLDLQHLPQLRGEEYLEER